MTYGAKDILTTREQLFEFLERGRRSIVSQVFALFITTIILISVFISIIDTVPWINAQYGNIFHLMDRVIVVIFVIEYLARLWVAPEHPLFEGHHPFLARIKTALTPLMIIDLIAILPFFLELFLGFDLAAVRVLRIFRFFRLSRYAPAIETIGRVLASEWRSLVGTAVIFAGVLLLSSVAMYYAESRVQPDVLGDIPSALWWAVTTLTTVGYGDVVPATALGKLIGGMVMIMGLLFLALPVGIVATGFQEEIKRRDFVVSFAMVARVPLFAGLKAPVIAHLAGVLRARKCAAGSVIVAKDDEADEMYFIASGEVEVELHDESVKLGEGDFFGEVALINRDAKRSATVIALRKTDLLVLPASDFRHLMHDSAELRKAVVETAQQRNDRKLHDNDDNG